jgi:branched-chain amino acid transport system permease protein
VQGLQVTLGPQILLGLLEGVTEASVLALTAVGLSLVFGTMRIVNIAHGDFFMLGAVLAWSCGQLIDGTPLIIFLVAWVIAPLVVGGIAVAIDWLILRRINYNPERTIVATIGLTYIIEQLVLSFYGPDARAVPAPIYFRIVFPWFGYSGYKLVLAGFAALLLLASWILMSRTKFGLYMRATQIDAEIAQAFGVPVRKIYAVVFAIGSMFAAIAGVLVVPIQQAHYLMGLDPLLLSFIVVILGGLGNLKGTLLAAVLIGLGDGVVSLMFSPTLSKIVATLAVALVLVIRPAGLLGEGQA